MSISRKLKNASSGAADGGGGSGGGYVDDVFSTYVYKGNRGTQTIENGIDLAGEGGLVWIKVRTSTLGHSLTDTERGNTKNLRSESTGAESTNTDRVTSFNSNGFSLSSGGYVNGNDDYVSWTFRKSPKFFDVVTYTGDGATNREIPHNLGIEPGMIIVKNTSNSADWGVYHKDAQHDGKLNSTEAFGYDLINDTSDSTFTLSYGNNETNSLNDEYVAYLFAHDDSDESIIKCGSFNTDGSGNATVDLGFEPQWLLWKASSATSDWFIHDTMREFTADGHANLMPNKSNAESNGTAYRINATGFDVVGAGANQTRIYMAIRRPNKPAEEFEPEELFAVDNTQAMGGDPRMVSGFPVDFAFKTQTGSGDSRTVGSRMTQGTELVFNTTAADRARTQHQFDYMDGWLEGDYAAWTSWMWRRAPGYFDVVCYEGDGTGSSTGRDINHNLGVVPDLMIIKKRNNTREWRVGGPSVNFSFGDSEYNGTLNSDIAFKEGNAGTSIVGGIFYYYRIPTIGHTATTFRVGYHSDVNASGDSYIAYLFASVPGISKVGSYTGTGAEINIDCGFTTGARFVLIKRTDATGDWYFWDSVRGITVGNDPYLLLNTADAQVTNTDYIDPLSSGFKVTASAPDAINAANGNYIFYAIA